MRLLIYSLIVMAVPSRGAVHVELIDARPTVEGVYVNGRGPFRFWLDTGANINLINSSLAGRIGMRAASRVEFASVTSRRIAEASPENEVSLESARASGQEFLLTEPETAQNTDVQGLLGQAFLSGFDYFLDLRHKQLTFGSLERKGTRCPFKMINGRPADSTSLGEIVLDSGAQALLISDVGRNITGRAAEIRSVAGSERGVICTRRLAIKGRKIWQGEAVAVFRRLEPGCDGVMPLRFFKSLYVCNSGRYVVFE
jgi:Aspartyl protease